MGIHLYETSAKENVNVEEMFNAITRMVLRSKREQKERQQHTQDNAIKLQRSSGNKSKKKCC